MNCKLVVIVFFQVAFISLGIPSGSAGELATFQSQGEKQVWQDKRVGVILEKVEIGKELSTESRGKFRGEIPEVSDGNVYVFVHLTVVKIKGVYMVFDYKQKGWAVLYDEEDKKHEYLTFSAELAGPLYYTNDYSAPMKFKEWNSCFFLFEISETSEPEKLKFVYHYRKKAKKGSSKTGAIEITIPKMQ